MGRIKFLFDRFIFSDELPLGHRIFNLVAGFGFLASLAAVTARTISGAPLPNIVITSMLMVILGVFLITCNIYRAYHVGMLTALVLSCNVVFPLIFFTSQGTENGMTAYFVLCLVLTAILMSGKLCTILLIINGSVFTACYVIDYLFPDLSIEAGSELVLYADNAHGYLISGLFIGALIKFKAKIHIEERKKAEAASEAKAAFLASVSHAIRTPLNAIMGFSELQLRKKLQEDTRHNFEKIHASGLTLLNIINDILDISSIETGNFSLDPSDYEIASTINDTIALNIVRIGSKKINFNIEIDPTLPTLMYGDELRIKQILNNILSNAFKYTEEGEVTFSVQCERSENIAWITVSVSDSGRGIRQEDMHGLFSDFHQVHTNGASRQEGTGLGLSISKNLTEMMGGAITVDSEYGKGSTFTVVFPQKIVVQAPIGEEMAKNLAQRRFSSSRSNGVVFEYAQMPYARVLVVDDVEINLMVAESLMQPYGLVIDCVSSGKEAVRRIREQDVIYDAIFMDHMMPQMDGMEAVRIIREEIDTEYARNIPIIALTANALVGNEEIFLSSGFQAFVPKPIDGARLDAILRRWLMKGEASQ